MREQTVFIEALEKEDPAERAAFLDPACAGDADLRERMERLLRRHQERASFLDSGQSPFATRGDEPIKEGPGTVIGHYKLLEQIGEGGFGVVFMAEQMQPVRRKVALKLLKPGMDTRQVVARFEAERQALALMDHPNIAQVFDGGETVSGRPYFVMELVRGIPITDFCDQGRLTLSDRLELFVHVCQAVQHAHHKGIIHRDLKPSNVLVTLHDGTPVAKVIDFGIAKAAGQQLTDKTLFTSFAQWIGTPLYMSPEQAVISGLDVDTRSDIYSLGVLLYELLTGTTPFKKDRFRLAAYDEIRRIIREEEPPTPSTRLSDSKDTLASISAQRHTEPAKLTKLVRGELDWIVMKALEKDRNRRYATANGLAMDLKRYLADEPVEARPSSARYRLRKFLNRNKGPVLAASIVLLALVGGIIGTTVGMIHADSRRIEADQARAAEAEQRTKAEKARDRTRQALDAMTSSFTEDSLSTQTAISGEQKRFLSEVLSYYQEFAGEKAGDEQSRARTAQAAQRVGTIEYRLGRRTEAEPAFRLARDEYEKLVADFPAVLRYRQELARGHYNLGIVQIGAGKGPEAEQLVRQALAVQERLAADFPTVPKYRQELESSHNNMGLLLAGLGKGPEAEQSHRQALAIGERLAAEFPAVREYRHELAESHNDLGVLLTIAGKRLEAEQLFRQALAIREKLAADFPAVPEYQINPQREQLRYRASRAVSRLNAGQVVEAVAEVAELSKTSDWNAEQWYDFACVYAVACGKIAANKQEYSDRAVQLLHRAVKTGFNNAAHMKKDTDLDPIRSREDFKKLMSGLEKEPTGKQEK
jgi:eukaryotic-like serine/threonine-protein kinase